MKDKIKAIENEFGLCFALLIFFAAILVAIDWYMRFKGI